MHATLIGLNLNGMGYPLGDVTGVYRVWAENAADGFVRMGIDVPWVYPILAFAPMAASLAFGPEWYAETWLGIVVLLDAAAFAVLLGDRRLSRTQAHRGVVVARLPRPARARSRSGASTRSRCRWRSPACSGRPAARASPPRS